MNMLLVAHYYEPNGGAASVRLGRLARYLQAQGHQVTVLTTMPHYPQGRVADAYQWRLFRRETRDGVIVVYTALWATPSKSIVWRLLSQLTFVLSCILVGVFLKRPDLIFIENQPIFTGVAGRVIADVKRVPYVLNVSDLWPEHLLTVGSMTADSTIYRVAKQVVDAGYRGASHIITMSPVWEEKILSYIDDGDGKVTTIYNGVDIEHFCPKIGAEITQFRHTNALPADKLWVSFIGTFATQYDFALLLDVAEHYSERDDVGFVFIGTGSEREYINGRIEGGKLPKLTLIDWVAYDDMPLAWNHSTVTYWAMRDKDLYSGTIPAKLYEAMACGIPMVAAQRGQATQMIMDAQAGIVVEPSDKLALINALEKVLADEQLRDQYRQNARAYAVENFNPDVVASRYENIFEQYAIARDTDASNARLR